MEAHQRVSQTTTTTLRTIRNYFRPPLPQQKRYRGSSSPNLPCIMSDSTTDFDKDLDEIAEKFKSNVKLSDRSYRLKTYKQCFVGSEAVDYLVQSGATATREDAVLLGNVFMEMHLIEHVLRDHPFKDEYLFYRFVGANERTSKCTCVKEYWCSI